ncbi:hypothetical protein NA56DRAFT_658086 [Hyaloscypha hepaticicola]|uniref:Uncharacterized protein n=1 Tax=Hyaloscypha hepaticicola TaxID=2082293 RepID=A0A2J6Q8V3_9HELO|nr:hypothetical protein NA56DRAFT_658086 [Hyaloscypha hepaticicola]
MASEPEKSTASDTANPQEAVHVTFDARSQFPPSFYDRSPLGDNEKFPAFGPKLGQKSRSLTQAEIEAGVIKEDEVAAIGERLQTEPAPLSLQEVRERRASIKEERKRNIDFIRARTNSRAAALGRPTPDSTGEGDRSAAANGRSSLNVVKEGHQN